MDVCCRPSAARSAAACPQCGTLCAAVESQTVRAIVTEASVARVRSGHHRFCAAPHCNVVYFDDTGRIFYQRDVQVPVWQKLSPDQRIVCYCFGETETSSREEIERSGSSGAVERVRAHVGADRCACAVRNPRGACCLGDLIAAVKRVSASVLAGEATPCQDTTESERSRA